MIEFWAQPKQSHPLRPLQFSQKETALMKTEIHKLLEKQAISLLSSPYNQSFFQNIPGPQKRRFSKASNKLTSVKPIRNLGTLQDGEHPPSRKFNPGGRLDDNGSKRCLFLHSNSQRASSLVTLPVAGTSVQVSVPPLWPILSPTSVHQSDTPHCSMVETTEDKNGSAAIGVQCALCFTKFTYNTFIQCLSTTETLSPSFAQSLLRSGREPPWRNRHLLLGPEHPDSGVWGFSWDARDSNGR